MDVENQEKPSFDVSCNGTMVEDVNVTQICEAMTDCNVQSK